MTAYPLLYVEWIDASTTGAAWSDVSDLKDVAPAYCRSVGWLIAEGPEHIVLAASIGDDEEDAVGNDISILKVTIKKRKRLKL